MFLTRDLNDAIKIWDCLDRNEMVLIDGEWCCRENSMTGWLLGSNRQDFRKLFPLEPMPRKGSCTYISNLKIVRA